MMNTNEINENKKFERKPIPNTAFDIEYRTEWREEVDFLASRGIYYTIRKREGEYGIPCYKYTKTADLFVALADFYLRNRRNVRSQSKFKGFNGEQLSFVNKEGKLNKEYVVEEHVESNPEPDTSVSNKIEVVTPKIEHNVIDLDKIKEAKRIYDEASQQLGQDELDKLISQDDTE